jgi:hypothetical protein
MPVIPASGEAEIWTITVKYQLRQKVVKTPAQLISQVWWFTLLIPAMWEAESKRMVI